eukprot:gnl/TRDRNA2_/TRDRNA2_176642_c0_seq4.p2 gnl/TRDRNA2_/TRDRNA2_176642_c0~~gnl/TRDRNA2_/TRDRNA2_176642_c0_seq4.p2  ORF type:complete len:101 (+),score=6.45 gnl/TRDRNA2_/TRDRNA2_176642_c0_seq4:197-499(+)
MPSSSNATDFDNVTGHPGNATNSSYVANFQTQLNKRNRTRHSEKGARCFLCNISGCAFIAKKKARLVYHKHTQHSKNGGRDFPCEIPSCTYTAIAKGDLS